MSHDASPPAADQAPSGDPMQPPRGRHLGALVATTTAWAALVAFALLSVGSALLGRTTFLATQIFEQVAPWAALDPAPPSDGLTNQWLGDTVDAIAPGMLLHQNSVREGEFASWDPYTVGGAAGASIPDDAVFSPLSLPWYLFPPAYAPGVGKLLEIGAITLGMSLLLRRFGLPSAAWALSSLVYSSSAYMVAWTNWPQTRVGALIPLLFWAVDHAVVERRPRSAVALAAVVASMLLTGFPAVTGMALYAAVVYAVARVLTCTREIRTIVRSGIVAAGGVLGGFGLAAFQILPFAHQVSDVIDFSVRQQTGRHHLDALSLATTVVPEIFGGPIQQHWSPKWNPIETFSYIGAAAVVLVLVALVLPQPTRRRRFLRTFMLGALAVTGYLIYVGGPVLELVQHLPVFSSNRINRGLSLLGFFAAVAAGIGLASILEPGAPRVAFRPVKAATADESVATVWHVDRSGWVRLGLAGLLAVALIPLVYAAWRTVPPEEGPEVRVAILRAGAYCLAAALATLLALFLRRRTARVLAGVVLPVLVLVPALTTVSVWWPKGDPSYVYAETPTHTFLAENLGGDRYATVGWTMLPGTSSAYGLRAATGHIFHTREWRDLLRAADPDVMTTATFSTLKSMEPEVLASTALDRLAVRFVVADPWMLAPGTVERLREGDGAVRLAPGEVGRAVVTTPFRGIIFDTPEGLAADPDGVAVEVRVLDADGELRGSTTQAIAGAYPPDSQMWFPLPGEWSLGERVTIEVSATAEPYFAVAGASPDDLAVSVVRPFDDDLRVAHGDGALVIERLSALPRVRWAGSEVVARGEAAVELLASPTLAADAVVLESADLTVGADGSTARVEVVQDEPTYLSVKVGASGRGWLVVADAFPPAGWHAYVDGRPAELVRADHALGAVAVKAGDHLVELRYEPPMIRPGLALTALTALILAVMLWLDRSRMRRTSRRAEARVLDSPPSASAS